MSRRSRRKVSLSAPKIQPPSTIVNLSVKEAKLYQTQIVPIINALLGDYLQYAPEETGDYRANYREMKEMIASSPIVSVAIEVRILLALSMLGKYKNPKNPKIQDFVWANEANIKGNFRQVVAKALTKYIAGYSFTEIVRVPRDGMWFLDRMVYVDPEYSRFKGAYGEVTELEFSSKFGFKTVPIWKGLHLVNQEYLNLTNSPYGLSAYTRIRALWKTLQVFMASLLVAAPKQAFPLLVGYAETNKQVVKHSQTDGTPILDAEGGYVYESAAFQLASVLKDVQNQSAIATDASNRIEAIAHQSDGKLLFAGINAVMRQILIALLVPSTPLMPSDNGSGDSNLGKVQLEFMKNLFAIDMEDNSDRLIDHVHKPNIIDNFGIQDTYGSYEILGELDPMKIALYGLVGDLTQKGVLSGQNIDLQKQVLESLDLPSSTLGTIPQKTLLPSN